MPSGDSAAADELWMTACRKDRWLGVTQRLEQANRNISDAPLWQ